MKKVIIALDGQHFPQGAFEFVKYVNTKSRVLLAGIFLSPVDYSKMLAYSGVDGIAYMPDMLARKEDDVLVSKNITQFDELCEKEGIEYKVHKDTDLMAISSLIEETRFADVLMLSSELFYENVQKEQPNFYLEEVLQKAECPVMLIPEDYSVPEQIILTYDGSESSVFAIKQFSYIFPELNQRQAILLSITHNGDKMPDQGLITELVSKHYSKLKVQSLHMSNKKDFIQWLSEQPDSFIIMGAFSRSLFSQLFKKSFAADVIKNIRMPIFISHK
jgi:hypothetical protein